MKAFLLYFLGGVRKGLRALGYRNLPELHEALEKDWEGDQLGADVERNHIRRNHIRETLGDQLWHPVHQIGLVRR